MSEERRIDMTDEQYQLVRKDAETIDLINDVMGHAIATMAERTAKIRMDMWDSVRRLVEAGKGDEVKIDWVSRQIIVTQQEDKTWQSFKS